MVAFLALLKELAIAAFGGIAGAMRTRRELPQPAPLERTSSTGIVVAGLVPRCATCGHRCTYCMRALVQTSDPPK